MYKLIKKVSMVTGSQVMLQSIYLKYPSIFGICEQKIYYSQFLACIVLLRMFLIILHSKYLLLCHGFLFFLYSENNNL